MNANSIDKCSKGCCAKKEVSPLKPDGRLSWTAAITCFLINFISACFYRCTGIFYSYIMDTFDATRGDASVPVSLNGGFYNMAGIAAGALIQHFGCRRTLILGGLMMTTGFGVSFFATSTLFLAFTVGVLAGSGHGIVVSCCIVAVTRYFDKQRGSALGVNMAGPSMTSLLVPKLLEWLLGGYGLRGTFLLLGGCMANISVLGILLRDPPWERSTGQPTPVKAQAFFAEAAKCRVEPEYLLVNRNNVAPYDDRNGSKRRPISEGTRRLQGVTSVRNLQEGIRGKSTIHSLVPATTVASKETAPSIDDVRRLSDRALLLALQSLSSAYRRSTVPASAGSSSRPIYLTRPVVSQRSASERRGSMMSVAGSLFASRKASVNERKVFSSGATLISVICQSTHSDGEKAGTEPTIISKATSSAVRSLKEVLCAPRMYFHTFSFFTGMFFMDTYLTVLFDLGEDVGLPISDSVLALSLLSAMDAISRLFIPFLTDHGVISTAFLLTLSYVALGVCSALVPYVSARLVFLAVSALVGLPGGYIVVGTSESLSKELGTTNIPMAYGVVAFIAALGDFTRPLLVGLFRDRLNSYDGLFQLMAGMLLSSFLFNTGLYINGRTASKERREQAAEDSTPVPAAEPRPTLGSENLCTSL